MESCDLLAGIVAGFEHIVGKFESAGSGVLPLDGNTQGLILVWGTSD
jgi:hypothetical protein